VRDAREHVSKQRIFFAEFRPPDRLWIWLGCGKTAQKISKPFSQDCYIEGVWKTVIFENDLALSWKRYKIEPQLLYIHLYSPERQQQQVKKVECHKRNRMWSIYNAWHFQWHWMTENSDYLTLNIPETVQERHYIRPILKRFNFECSWAISSSLANFQRHRVSRDLFATAELLVTITFHFITALIPWIFENCK